MGVPWFVRFNSVDEMLEETRHGWSVPYVGWLNVSEAKAGNEALGWIGEDG
jgi:hypothetical protein